MLEEQLKKFGLSEKEAKTYMTLLVLGKSSVTKIAENSGVNRSSAYVVLEALEKKGLVKSTESDKVQQFKAAPPEKLAQIAEDQLKRQKEIHETVKNILPDLKGVHVENEFKPKIRVLEGREGLIQAFEETLSSREKLMRVVSSVSQFSKILPKAYFPSYVKRRIKAGVVMRGIHPQSKFTQLMKRLVPESVTEATLIPAEKFNFPADIAIFDDSVAYMTHESGGYAVEIVDKRMAETMKNLFDLAEAEAKRLNGEVD